MLDLKLSLRTSIPPLMERAEIIHIIVVTVYSACFIRLIITAANISE